MLTPQLVRPAQDLSVLAGHHPPFVSHPSYFANASCCAAFHHPQAASGAVHEPATAGAAAPTSPPGAPTEAALAAAAVSGFAAGLDARRLQRCAEGAALGPLGGRTGRGHLEAQVVQYLLPDVHAVLRQLATTPLAELQVSRGALDCTVGSSPWTCTSLCIEVVATCLLRHRFVD